MDEQPKLPQWMATVGALLLWLVTFGLGLQSIYIIKELYFLITMRLGGNMVQAERYSSGLIFVLALVYLVFLVASTEYHMKRIGKPQSWRLFAWTLGVELGLLVLYYIL